MDTSKHTPTPWEACDAFGPTENGQSVKAVADDKMILSTTGYYGRDGAIANADFIVRACNSHDQLVAALRACAYADSGTRDQAVDHARELLVELGVAGA